MTSGPSCPECGEPVGERAVYCMHCGAEFGDDGPGTADDGPDSSVPLDAEAGAGPTAGATAGTRGGSEPAGSGAAEPGRGDLLDRLFHPDGLLDDSLTVVVGVAVGVVCGFVVLLVFAAAGGGAVGLLAGFVAFVGVTGWLARQYSLFGAVRGGCYALAVALLLLPVVALTDAAEGGTLGGQVLLFVVGEIVLGAFALPLVGIGYVAGTRRPEPPDAT